MYLPRRHRTAVLDRVESIGWRVQYLVDHVVARCHETGREKPDEDIDPQSRGNVRRIASNRGDDARDDEHIFEPVIDSCYLDVTANRGAGGHDLSQCANAHDSGCHVEMLDGQSVWPVQPPLRRG